MPEDKELWDTIVSICAKADLSTLTLRMVRGLLEQEHSIDVDSKKKLIRAYVDRYVEAGK